MATAKDFVARVSQIDGVAGCLLIKDNGACLGDTLGDVENYTALLLDSIAGSNEIMEKTGFSYCRHISFQRNCEENFYIFPIGHYLLGVLLHPDNSEPVMIEQVSLLINRVSIGGSAVVS